MDRRESPVSATAGVEAEIERQGVLPPGMRGTDAAAAVLCVLAQRLSRGQARDLVAGLPEGLRPRVQACARHRGEPGDAFDYDEFRRRVAAHLDISEPEAEDTVRAVFAAVRRTLPAKEQHDVLDQLPRDLEQLWQSTSA
jgi:uncharacterized protein (DUF2267 family)